MVSFITTQLLAVQSVNATKFETSKTELSVMVKPIVFEYAQLNLPDVKPIVFEYVQTHEPIIETAVYEVEYLNPDLVNNALDITADKYPKQGKGYNYSKHNKKAKRKKFFARLFNTDNCNHYRKHGYV